MALGLESNIAETAKAFQGNPQALQQRYTQKQDLFDLLALNMIKKNQDAAKRSLMLSQQKMPGTVLEQVEGAVTKNAAEKVKGVAGALATKNAQTQKNMQKMAGVSGAPAPNMAKMAGGGIVGFAAGKEVKGSQPTDAELKMVGLTRDEYDKLDKADKYGADAIIEKNRTVPRGVSKELSLKNKSLVDDSTEFDMGLEGRDRSLSELQALVQGPNAPSKQNSLLMNKLAAGADAKTIEKLNKMSGFTPKVGPGVDNRGILSNEDRMQQGQLSGLASLKKSEVTDDKPVIPGAGVDSFSADKSGGVTAAPAFDASKFAADGAFNQKVKGGIKDLLDSDPQKAVDFAARTPAEKAFIAKMLQERTDMRDNRLNPDKLSSDRLSQMLLGAKGATAGEAFRTAGLAGINADRNVENIKRSEFDALNKLFMTEADRSQSIKQKAFEGSQADKKQGVASGTSLTTSEKTAALEADKLVQKISNDKIANSLRGDLNTIQKQRNSIMATGNTVKSNTQVIKLYKDTETKQILAAQKVYEAEKKNNLLKPAKERADLDRKAKERMDADIAQIRKTIALESKPFENSLKALSTQTGGVNTGGFKKGSMKVS